MKSLIIFLFVVTALPSFAQEKPAVPSQPTREIAVILTKEGYYPKSLSVFVGEKVKFFVTSTVEEPGCLIVEGHKVFMAANKGKITESEVVFDRAGEFPFYCPSSKNDGKVVVLKKVNTNSRDIASEKEKESLLWTPKEY